MDGSYLVSLFPDLKIELPGGCHARQTGSFSALCLFHRRLPTVRTWHPAPHLVGVGKCLSSWIECNEGESLPPEGKAQASPLSVPHPHPLPRGPFPRPHGAWKPGLWPAGQGRGEQGGELVGGGPHRASRLLEGRGAGGPRRPASLRVASVPPLPSWSPSSQALEPKPALCFESLQNATRIMSLLLLRSSDGSPRLSKEKKQNSRTVVCPGAGAGAGKEPTSQKALVCGRGRFPRSRDAHGGPLQPSRGLTTSSQNSRQWPPRLPEPVETCPCGRGPTVSCSAHLPGPPGRIALAPRSPTTMACLPSPLS